MLFDARAAKQLKAGEHLVIVGCPGLRLVATATRRTWTYRYQMPGGDRMKQIALGQWPAMTVQTAASEWETLRAKRFAGIDPGQARRNLRKQHNSKHEDPASYTVQAVVLDYLANRVDHTRKPAGALAARRALEQLLADAPGFAGQAAAGLTRAAAFDLLDARKGTPTAAIKLRSMLGAAWDFALDAGRLPGNAPNWWRLVMRGRLQSKGKIVGGKHQGRTRRYLRGPEVGQLVNWLPNMHPLGRDITTMYLWTCTRGVEICAMRPEHLAREPDGLLWWTVPKALTKNAANEDAVDLRVPLFGRAREVVERRLKGVGASGWLFERRGGGQYLQKTFSTYVYSLQAYSEKVARRGGGGLICPVQGWTPHNLRRTSRTLLSALGCTDEVGEAIIGHMPREIVSIYNLHSYDAERVLWLGKLAEHLEGLAVVG